MSKVIYFTKFIFVNLFQFRKNILNRKFKYNCNYNWDGVDRFDRRAGDFFFIALLVLLTFFKVFLDFFFAEKETDFQISTICLDVSKWLYVRADRDSSFALIDNKNPRTEVFPDLSFSVKSLIFVSRALSAAFRFPVCSFVMLPVDSWYRSLDLTDSCKRKLSVNLYKCAFTGSIRWICEFIASCDDVVRISKPATEMVFLSF